MTNNTETTDRAALDEAIALEAEVAKVNAEVAEKLAATFDESADVFKRAGILARGIKRGATLAEVAALTTRHRVIRAFPNLTPEEVDDFLADEKRVRKLRLSVSKSSVQAYVSAWNAVVDSTLMPNRETVAIMFRAKSTGGTKDLIAEAVAATQEAETGEKEETLIRVLSAGLRTLTAVKKSVGRPNDGDTGEGEGEGGQNAGSVGYSLEGAMHTIGLIFAQDWTDEERATLAAHVSELAGLAETV